MSEVSERIREFIDSIGISLREFERSIGVSNGYIQKSTAKGLNPSVADRVAALYPSLDMDWLLTGRPPQGSPASDLVPLLPIVAWAGSIGDYYDSVDLSSAPRFALPVKADFLISVSGDSMEPDYFSGDMLAIRRILDPQYIGYGNVYVIDTIDGSVFKEIQAGKKDGFITCVSRNSERYKPYEIPTKDYINGIYKVVGIFRPMWNCSTEMPHGHTSLLHMFHGDVPRLCSTYTQACGMCSTEVFHGCIVTSIQSQITNKLQAVPNPQLYLSVIQASQAEGREFEPRLPLRMQ